MKTLTKQLQNAITPEIALHLLQKGNKRFVNNLKVNRNLVQQVSDTSDGQHPFAIILSCMDSRTSVELIFDQGLGDVFSVRIAGTIINEDILGSIEFACKIVGVKIIVVLGHTQCGAIKGACDQVVIGNLTALLSKIQPAISAEQTIFENRTSSNCEFVEKVTTINIQKTVHALMERSPILKELIETNKCGIIGACHNISTGNVNFYKKMKFGFFKSENKNSYNSETTLPNRAKL